MDRLIGVRSWIVIALLTLSLGAIAQAFPTYGVNCTSCHMKGPGHMAVSGQTTTKDLGAARLDKVKAGALKVFAVQRGHSVTINIDVTNGASKYAAEVYLPKNRGLLHSLTNKLIFTPDPKWTGLGSTIKYWVNNRNGSSWSGTKTRLTFTIAVDAKTPVDYYELYIRVAGKGGGMWSQTTKVYLQVKK